MSMDFIAQNAKAKLGKEPKDLRVAIIHEDGAYGVDVVEGQRGRRQEGRLQHRAEGRLFRHGARPVGAGDQARSARGPDVIFHTGYNPDITLFLRQAREQG